jgi:hypothetical protein
MKPNKNNFCGGNFQDWLEVNLTDKCNGKCVWCIEKAGYHPEKHAGWQTIVKKAIESDKYYIAWWRADDIQKHKKCYYLVTESLQKKALAFRLGMNFAII